MKQDKIVQYTTTTIVIWPCLGLPQWAGARRNIHLPTV